MVRTIKNVLISQNAPADVEQSPYKQLTDKYKLNLTFNKFFEVVKISNKEYRAQRINLLDYTAVIMTSKLAVDHYFLFAKEMRITIPDDMKFFCITETVANYLQTYIQYRKRKIFPGNVTFDELVTIILKHKDEKFLFPCAEDASSVNFKKLEAAKIPYTKIIMYRSKPKDLSKVDIHKYDMVVLFAPIGVQSLRENFPDITSDDICIAAFGKATISALQKAKFKVTVPAPTAKYPSMIMALEHFFETGGEIKISKKTTASDKLVAVKTSEIEKRPRIIKTSPKTIKKVVGTESIKTKTTKTSVKIRAIVKETPEQ